jgi:hypothetical protein
MEPALHLGKSKSEHTLPFYYVRFRNLGLKHKRKTIWEYHPAGPTLQPNLHRIFQSLRIGN